MMNNHFFHLVDYSPWPLVVSLNFFNLGMSIYFMLNSSVFFFFFVNIIVMILILYQWWRDVIREGLYEGKHTMLVKRGLGVGVLMFIVSELFFFVSFFWMFFYVSLSPSVELGLMWPPAGYEQVSFLDIPLINTLILLSSGVFVTWCHMAFMVKKSDFFLVFKFSIILGFYFIVIQGYEYFNVSFSFADGVFGSSFFILSGFHGFHVIVGLLFLLVNYVRFGLMNFSMTSSYGFEFAIWYWHFVDVIWLFLYLLVYWWGM